MRGCQSEQNTKHEVTNVESGGSKNIDLNVSTGTKMFRSTLTLSQMVPIRLSWT